LIFCFHALCVVLCNVFAMLAEPGGRTDANPGCSAKAEMPRVPGCAVRHRGAASLRSGVGTEAGLFSRNEAFLFFFADGLGGCSAQWFAGCIACVLT